MPSYANVLYMQGVICNDGKDKVRSKIKVLLSDLWIRKISGLEKRSCHDGVQHAPLLSHL